MATGSLRTLRFAPTPLYLGVALIATAAALPSARVAASFIVDALLAGRGAAVASASPFDGNPLAPTSVSFQQGVAGYTGAVDTYINANSGAATTDNSGAVTLTVDLAPDVQQGLIKFGGLFVSEGGPIPNTATINSASLTVNVTNVTAVPIGLHRMKQAWSAANTWNTFGATPWNATAGIQIDGVEAEITPDASSTVPAAGLNTVTFNVLSGIQAWASNPASNFGWVLNETTDDGLVFDSSEGATATNRPKLSITYTAAGCTTGA